MEHRKLRFSLVPLIRRAEQTSCVGPSPDSISQTSQAGQSIGIELPVVAPKKKGRYILEVDLVHELVTWFAQQSSEPLRVPLKVISVEEVSPGKLDLSYGEYTSFNTRIESLGKLSLLIPQTLEANRRVFDGATGKIFAFQAGSAYPQVWVRDSATIVPVARFYYGKEFLSSWIIEHLHAQGEDGSINDWVAPGGKHDKNTVETDQEASLVDAAYEYSLVNGFEWLAASIRGAKTINRLENALEYVRTHRFDEKYELVKGAHTIDWGDVDIVDADQQAIYVNRNTHWTIDLYDQAMFHKACLQLADLMDQLGLLARSKKWRKRAAEIRKRTNELLWQEEKGFYSIHLHLDDLVHSFDEADMFALGGNVEAISSGIASSAQARRIIQTALERQKKYNMSTISGVLLPPYPAGIFRHPAVDEPYEYQNGGQWDWFGGRLILAMFQNGYSSEAIEKLQEIAKKSIANKGFFEWDEPNGKGRGSFSYAGSAGAIGRAIFEGLFGVSIIHDELRLRPRLLWTDAKIHVHQPAGNRFVAYAYTAEVANKLITLELRSNFARVSELNVLLPDSEAKVHRVELDGRARTFKVDRRFMENYLSLESVPPNCSIRIFWR